MNRRYLGVGLVLILGLGGGIFFVNVHRPVPKPTPVLPTEKIKGPLQAPIQIIEYSDFQCPACRQAQAELSRIMAAHPNQIELVFRHFPLPGHQWSGLAHQAAECAHEQGRFWDYHYRLYAQQLEWGEAASPAEIFLQDARDLGLDLDRFAACLGDVQVGRKVLADKSDGERLKITATPTFFINGERVVGPRELQMKGDALIRRMLESSPAPTKEQS